MSEELKNVCENCGFSEEFRELLGGMEIRYNEVAEYENTLDGMTFVEWILENTKLDDFKCLTEKERFILGMGVLMSELARYF